MDKLKLDILDLEASGMETLLERLDARRKLDYGEVTDVVNSILAWVKEKGDRAVLDYSLRFDGCLMEAEEIRIPEEAVQAGVEATDPELYRTMERAAARIRRFHEEQLKQAGDYTLEMGEGEHTEMRVRPLDTVGIYVPGGTAPLPSSVLMNAIPAKVAGVRRLVMATPPQKTGINPAILAAAYIAGVDEIYQVGGAQAVAALAYGTEMIPACDKICGPGNIYVNAAKRMVYGQVDIDFFAGPSEILIVADGGANPEWMAADLLSQAEHDKLASAVVLTDAPELASKVQAAVLRQAGSNPRHEILERSLSDFAAVVVCADLSQAMEFANRLAPEHLELCVAPEREQSLLDQVENAASVFVGYTTPEPLGDYIAGPNHVLPTSGSARYASPLNVNDFLKKMSVIRFDRAALDRHAEDVIRFASAEGLHAHAQSIAVRRSHGAVGTDGGAADE